MSRGKVWTLLTLALTAVSFVVTGLMMGVNFWDSIGLGFLNNSSSSQTAAVANVQPSIQCMTAVSKAEGNKFSLDDPNNAGLGMLDEGITKCESLDVFLVAVSFYPKLLDGQDPRMFALARCTMPETAEIKNSKVCGELMSAGGLMGGLTDGGNGINLDGLTGGLGK